MRSGRLARAHSLGLRVLLASLPHGAQVHVEILLTIEQLAHATRFALGWQPTAQTQQLQNPRPGQRPA